MVKEINGLAEFEREIRGPGLVVVDFFTTWCGPCKQIAPFIEALAVKYPEVKFLKVDIEKNEDVARPRNIQSIPTFHFYVNGSLKDEMKGANAAGIEQKVVQYKVDANPFGGSGFKLAAAAGDGPAMSAREARLKQFGDLTPAPARAPVAAAAPVAAPAPAPVPMDVEEQALAQALAVTSSSSSAQETADYAAAEQELAAMDTTNEAPQIHTEGASGWDEEMVPVPVDAALLAELLDMGFSDTRARKGLVHGSSSIDGALQWLDAHQEDADIDQPYMVRLADTLPKAPLSAEEKARRLEDMKNKIKTRREERARQDKAEEVKREKERRERGQRTDETMEERQRLQRKREAERLKKEKEDSNKERLRLKAEIARDKEIRKLNAGVIPSVLGVDGYNPSAIQYDTPASAPASAAASAPSAAPIAPAVSAPAPVRTAAPKKTSSAAVSPPPEGCPEDRIDQAIATISRYRTGGDGGQALKLLLTFVRNVVEHPAEAKYRAINPDSAAFKAKLASLVGPMALLRALGFEKDEEGKLRCPEASVAGPQAEERMRGTLRKLEAAEATYRAMNP